MIELSNSKKTYLGKDVLGRSRYALDCSIGAVQMRETGGEWQDIDPSVEALDADGSTVNFTKTPMLVKVGEDSKRRIYPDKTDLSYWIEFQKPFASMGKPTRSNRWFYWDFLHATIGVRVANTRVKFAFKLKDSFSPTSITIPFTSQGITRQGSLLYHDGKVVAALLKPFAVDANGVERDVAVTFQSGRIMLSLDTTGLVYPITIDPTIDVSVGASTDDCLVYYNGSAWGITTTQVNLYPGYALSTVYAAGGGMRFLAVNIPAGATITSAFLTLIGDSTTSNTTVNSGICGELNANAATFGTVANYQARRGTDAGGANNNNRTVARVAWDNIGGIVADTSYDSPSIVSVLQEMVDTVGALTDIAIFFDDHDDRSTHLDWRYRPFASWDHATRNPPALHIEYTEGGAAFIPKIIFM